MNQSVIRHDDVCRICGSGNVEVVFEMEPTPPEDQFVSDQQLGLNQPCYPLNLSLCNQCGYLHLSDILDPQVSYIEYNYQTKTSLGLSELYLQQARSIIDKFEIPPNAFVVDLGSNDGTMLSAYQKNGLTVLGVEPAAAIAKLANENGIETLNEYFDEATVENVATSYGRPDLITANYMLANIDDVVGFVKNVAKLLDDNGIFVVMTGYHPEQFKIKMFDFVYHEHFSYFSVNVLKTLFAKAGLQVIDVEKTHAKGGSIRITAQKTSGLRSQFDSVKRFIDQENHEQVHLPQTYINLANEIDTSRKALKALLQQYKSEGKSIAGYGASHSTTTFVYHFGLQGFLDFQVDDNEIKQGSYSPGHHIPVYSPAALYESKPDVVVILAWNYAAPIIDKNKEFLEQGGIFVVPLPELKVVSK